MAINVDKLAQRFFKFIARAGDFSFTDLQKRGVHIAFEEYAKGRMSRKGLVEVLHRIAAKLGGPFAAGDFAKLYSDLPEQVPPIQDVPPESGAAEGKVVEKAKRLETLKQRAEKLKKEGKLKGPSRKKPKTVPKKVTRKKAPAAKAAKAAKTAKATEETVSSFLGKGAIRAVFPKGRYRLRKTVTGGPFKKGAIVEVKNPELHFPGGTVEVWKGKKRTWVSVNEVEALEGGEAGKTAAPKAVKVPSTEEAAAEGAAKGQELARIDPEKVISTGAVGENQKGFAATVDADAVKAVERPGKVTVRIVDRATGQIVDEVEAVVHPKRVAESLRNTLKKWETTQRATKLAAKAPGAAGAAGAAGAEATKGVPKEMKTAVRNITQHAEKLKQEAAAGAPSKETLVGAEAAAKQGQAVFGKTISGWIQAGLKALGLESTGDSTADIGKIIGKPVEWVKAHPTRAMTRASIKLARLGPAVLGKAAGEVETGAAAAGKAAEGGLLRSLKKGAKGLAESKMAWAFLVGFMAIDLLNKVQEARARARLAQGQDRIRMMMNLVSPAEAQVQYMGMLRGGGGGMGMGPSMIPGMMGGMAGATQLTPGEVPIGGGR